MDISSFPSADELARRSDRKRYAAWEAVIAELGELEVYPLIAVETIVARHGCHVGPYRHDQDTWVLELPADQEAMEVYVDKGATPPLGKGPAFAASTTPTIMDPQDGLICSACGRGHNGLPCPHVK
ncbi:MAG: hypothetical protein Q7S10_03810 [bacterium]|nr:hypothetical protein [bacterium]